MDEQLVCAPGDGVMLGQLFTPTQALLQGFTFVEAGAVAAQNEVRTAVELAAGRAFDGVQARQGFRVGSLNLMIGYADSSELTEMPDIYRIPNAPDWFCGMANLHGMLTPVFDLSRYLDVERDNASKRMLLVLSHGADAAGVVIDGMPERLRWGVEQQTDAATVPDALFDVVDRAALIGEKLWFDLNCNTLLDRLETALTTSH